MATDTDELALVAATAQELLAAARGRGDGDTARESAAGWQALDEQGMTRVSVPQPGGAGESLLFLGALLKAAGRAAFSVPLIETHVGATLLGAAGFPEPPAGSDTGGAYAVGLDPRLLCPAAPEPACLAVAHPGLAETVVTAVRDGDAVNVHVWKWGELGLDSGRNAAGEAIATVDLRKVPPPSWSAAISVGVARDAALTDALGRSLMIVGAAERALAQTLGHVGEREQFGRPLAAFQSVQQAIAQMASMVTAASVSADAALAALDSRITGNGSSGDDDAVMAVLACRIQCSRTAAFVARAAHQLHGAIGFTQEHSLRFATTRLTAWRAHGPTHAEAAREIGRRAFAASDLWPMVAASR
jgi:acyl-CoA dehydrogenase